MTRHAVGAFGLGLGFSVMLGLSGWSFSGCAFTELSTQPCLLNEDVTAACATCERQACCPEVKACRESDTCAALDDCLATCAVDDGTCRVDCASINVPDEPAAALSACRARECDDTCVTCGGFFATPEPACDACMIASCCEERLACDANAACIDAWNCLEACAHPGCSRGCRNDHRAGIEPYEALLGCAIGTCGESCKLGSRFACQDAYDLPPPAADVLVWNEYVLTFAGEAIPDVTVKACLRQDVDCVNPVGEEVTDAYGGVFLDLPTTQVGFEGYLSYSGADVYPAIRFPSAPIVRDALLAGFFPMRVNDFGADVSAIFLEDSPSHGHMVVRAKDCLDVPSGGIRFELEGGVDPGATSFYFKDGLPVIDATETSAEGILYNGLGGWVNLPAGSMVVRAVIVATGEELDSQAVLVRPGTLSYVNLSP